MAIIGTIEVQYGTHKITTNGPVIFDENLDLKDLFIEMMNAGYSPNAFHCGLVEAIEDRIKLISDFGFTAYNLGEYNQWRETLQVLRPDTDS